jgi:ArsR family transcriptional regulator
MKPIDKVEQKMTSLSRDAVQSGEAAEVLKAIAHPLRLRIVAILCDGDEHVNGLAERLGVPQSIVSQQLRILRMRDLVAASRKNGHSLYRLAEPHLKKIIRCMEGCLEERGGKRR